MPAVRSVAAWVRSTIVIAAIFVVLVIAAGFLSAIIGTVAAIFALHWMERDLIRKRYEAEIADVRCAAIERTEARR